MERVEEATASAASQSRLKSLQDAGWLLLVILAPLWANYWGQQPFELPKVMLMRTLVWLLTALALVEYILTRRSLRRDLRANPMLGPVGVLALVIVVTTVTAVDWRLSLWALFILGTTVLAQSSASYDLRWHVIGSGGGESSSASYRVNGTVGQGMAGQPASVSADFAVGGGYWFADAGTAVYLPVILRN